MATTIIKKESFDFLKKLSKNNNREWFNAHKGLHMEAHENMIAFADALLAEIRKHDNIQPDSGKKCMFRVYKDVCFSKDKTPYNIHWSGSLKRATKQLRGGYYFNIKPGNSFLAGGFWGPEPNDIKRIRQDIDLNYKDWKKMLGHKTLMKTFGKLMGDQVSSTPRGYSKDHTAIDLLRYKQFILKHDITDKIVCSPNFVYRVADVFIKLRPFFDSMSEVLTTDANGISLVE